MMILTNGSFETIVATEKEGSYYPIGMDDLAEQFSGMIKRNFNPIRHSRENRGRGI
jgi:hypothetical protein